jgi:hypothetical protein
LVFSGVWIVLIIKGITAEFDPNTGRDILRTADTGLEPPVSLSTALDTWSLQQGGSDQIVLVAAAGGGIRASYWTSLVLAHAADKAPALRRKMFLASGVSGGSLGLAVYRAALEAGDNCGGTAADGLERCIRAFHAHDFLGAPVGATLTGMVFNFIVSRSLFPTRASALESSWDVAWQETIGRSKAGSEVFRKPLTSLGGQHPGPSLLLNATAVSDGDRIVSSPIDTDGWLHTRGASEDPTVTCEANVSDSTQVTLAAAAGASARFPFLSEWGWFMRPERPSCPAEVGLADGGFFDNYGAATLIDAMKALRATRGTSRNPFRPIVIQITSDPDCDNTVLDNHEDGPSECKVLKPVPVPNDYWKTWQWWLPWIAGYSKLHHDVEKAETDRMYSVLGFGPDATPGPLDILFRSRSTNGIARAAQLREETIAEGGSYYHFSMAGIPAEPLSWSLSGGARADLDALLKQGRNARVMCRLIAALEGKC